MTRTKKLKKQAIIYIEPTKPFNFKGTFSKPSHYSSKLVLFERERIFHSIELMGQIFGVEFFEPKSIIKKVGVIVYAEKSVSSDILKSIKSEVVSRYNLNGDIKEFIDKYKKDSFLSGPIKRWCGMRPSVSYSLYGFLMIATLLQNTTIKRSVQMTDVLLNKYGTRLLFAGKEIFAMWKPEDIDNIDEMELRNLRIGYRAKNIKRISESFTSGSVSENILRGLKSQNEVRQKLLEIYGVGPQSVSYLLFEAFHFYDALDHLSPWEGKIVSMLLYGNKTTVPEHTLEDVKNRWGKWRMLAIHYMFEDLFWRRNEEEIPWLEEEIRM